MEKKLCGEPSGELKEIIDGFNVDSNGSFIVKQKSCYPGYADIYLFADKFDYQLLKESLLSAEIHGATVNVEVLVYNSDKKLISGNTGRL